MFQDTNKGEIDELESRNKYIELEIFSGGRIFILYTKRSLYRHHIIISNIPNFLKHGLRFILYSLKMTTILRFRLTPLQPIT